MGWTDERVAKLRDLWGSGKSASEIAEILGGVSRNAVIGKAHRLGLSGRPSPIRKREEGDATAPVRPATAAASATSAPARSAAASAAPAASRTAEPRPRPAAPPAQRPAPVLRPAEEIGPGDGATILNLTERMCRWPIGDPKQPGFRFCGRPSAPGVPYCAEHASVAYQTPNGGKKRDEEKQTA